MARANVVLRETEVHIFDSLKHGLDVTAGLFSEWQMNESEQRLNVVVRGCINPSYHLLQQERQRMIRQRGGKVRIIIS